MAYAEVGDMVMRFGEMELVRYTTPEDQPGDAIDVARVEQALSDASDLIDTYLRRRYAVPLAAPVPASINTACCTLARVELANTSRSMPTTEQKEARDRSIAWLKQLDSGAATLDGLVAANTSSSYARVSDRVPPLSRGRCW